ncbi:MAG: molybdenum cofactor guanylyltransferase MobA [Azospira oryzae]|nr:MAG: molybdenum cofactor guanylyltransferase MobA [Azospira oryzae]PZP75044.1 MAG: molybdenum cofactor guanylyltransferase MobA [Azospira oryzae]
MKVTGVLLAGGKARRMGGVDKGLRPLKGKPLAQWVLERFAPQVDEILVNANQNLDQYARFGYRVIPDLVDGFAGPLAGLHRGLGEASHPLVATVPCDSPFLPPDLVSRLRAALEASDADLAVARTFDQPHPVFCLCRRALKDHLGQYLAGGGRKIDAWYASLRVIEVPFDDEAEAFRNINTPEELSESEQRVGP